MHYTVHVSVKALCNASNQIILGTVVEKIMMVGCQAPLWKRPLAGPLALCSHWCLLARGWRTTEGTVSYAMEAWERSRRHARSIRKGRKGKKKHPLPVSEETTPPGAQDTLQHEGTLSTHW